ILPMLLGTTKLGVSRAIVPRDNGPEAAHAAPIGVSLAEHPAEIVRHFRNGVPLESPVPPPQGASTPGPDLADLRGMPGPRRALEVAAAGGHGVLMLSAVGSGRLALARRLPGILPELTPEEAIEVTCIHSVAGRTGEERPFVASRPF